MIIDKGVGGGGRKGWGGGHNHKVTINEKLRQLQKSTIIGITRLIEFWDKYENCTKI